MGKYVAEQTVKHMIRSGSQIKGAIVNVLGIAFKEDVPDLRNSKVVGLIRELRSFGLEVRVHDPVVDAHDARREYGIDLVSWDALPQADALVVAVAHRAFVQCTIGDLAPKIKPAGCFIDVKSCFDVDAVRKAGLNGWRL